MDHNLKEVDLRWHIKLGVESILGTLDRRREGLPFFSYKLVEPPICAKHGAFDSPHVVGRYLDVLSLGDRIIDLPDDQEAYDMLTNLLHRSMNTDDGLAWNEPTKRQQHGAVTHNQREALLGLVALIRWRGCEKSKALARRLCRGIERETRATGCYPGFCLDEDSWTGERTPGERLPEDCGRLIGALVKYYRLSSDPAALDLAKRFADGVLKFSFDTDGRFKESAGGHTHSITGTITSLVDFGILINNRHYIEAARRAYDVGLPPYRSSYGWVKENRFNDSDLGEANNTADVIESAILLGKAGYPSYYEDAERMLRNHLLASQLIDTHWLHETPGMADTEEEIYSDVIRRARGGFIFSEPNNFTDFNSDLTGGATQGLCEAWEAIISRGEVGVRVNLLFSKKSDILSIRSHIPEQGKVEIEMFGSTNLFVRIPSWVKSEDISLSVDGEATSISTYTPYICVPNLERGAKVEIEFPQRKTVISEEINHKIYQVKWLGDTVVSISPEGKVRSLYKRRGNN